MDSVSPSGGVADGKGDATLTSDWRVCHAPDVDVYVRALVNSCLPIAKGKRGQLRENRGTPRGID